jgi:pimeloyl-ACP methyl ester carboxylesterase
MDALLATGDRDGVVEALFRGVEDMSDEDMAAFKAAASWPGRVAAAHTVTREIRGERTALLDSRVAAKLTVPVLLLTGERSADPAKSAVEAVATALPNARIVVLKGQEHVADVLAPETIAGHLIPFFND